MRGVITGLMLGDGSISINHAQRGVNPYLYFGQSLAYLRYL